jgi:hypothetical protein
MTEREIAPCDANTWRIIAGHNAIPQTALGGDSPRDLIFGSRKVSDSLREASNSQREAPMIQVGGLQGSSFDEKTPPKRGDLTHLTRSFNPFGGSPSGEDRSKSQREGSAVKIEELQGSSSCDDPPPKRFRLDGQPGRDSPPRESGSSSDSSPDSPEEFVLVSRLERSVLLSRFRREQRVARKRFKLEVRETWDRELADDKEN